MLPCPFCGSFPILTTDLETGKSYNGAGSDSLAKKVVILKKIYGIIFLKNKNQPVSLLITIKSLIIQTYGYYISISSDSIYLNNQKFIDKKANFHFAVYYILNSYYFYELKMEQV